MLNKEKKGLLEKIAYENKLTLVGVDEVGRGCLAGPVYTAAVILDLKKLYALTEKERSLVRDSKKLSLKQKIEASALIAEIAKAQAIGIASEREVESKGILGATFLAMRRAITQIEVPYDRIYVDGNQTIPEIDPNRQKAIIKGDSLSYTIAAASILAKQARDQYMKEQALVYPGYGFENHVGYGTKAHFKAICELGVTSLHRKTFAPIKDLL